MYRFDQVEGGSYTVTISGYPLDATFAAASAVAEIVVDGQTVIVDFRGMYIRTASVMGRVAVEGHGLAGAAVRLAGMSEGLASTNAVWQFGFQSLRAGAYTVEISDFGDAEFPATSQSVSLAVGESTVLSFDGTYIRRSSVSVVVSAEGEGLQGIALRLLRQDHVANGVTDATGRHRFTRLRAGTYALGISGFDADEVEFPDTIKTVTVAADETRSVAFDGKKLRTAEIGGVVSVEGAGLGGVTVTLAGQEEDLTAVTEPNGQYAFTNLRQGTYSVWISGFDSDEIRFSKTAFAVTVSLGESKIVSFDGTYFRTSGILGQVSVDGRGLEGVTVSLAGGPDAVEMSTTTDASGQYSFARLRAGDYVVAISGYDTAQYQFPVTQRNVTVSLGEAANVPFEGKYVR